MRVAQDTAAATMTGSALLAAYVPWIIEVEPYIHAAASVFAIVGVVVSIMYYRKRIKYLEWKMRDKDDD
jgi:membrane protein YdbS with pleckstrin-like domain